VPTPRRNYGDGPARALPPRTPGLHHLRSESASRVPSAGGGSGGGNAVTAATAAAAVRLHELNAAVGAARHAATEKLQAVMREPERLLIEPVAALRGTRAYGAVGRPIEAAIAKPLNRVKDLARAELDRVEARLRARFRGYDDSHSAQKLRAARLSRYRALFESLDSRGRCVWVGVGGWFRLVVARRTRVEAWRRSFGVDDTGTTRCRAE
jgi:hypothetical protein